MKLRKCAKCREYNLTDICRKCKEKTEPAHYKFLKLKDEEERHPDFKR